ncbi:MAG TPA: C1 family peptidase [Williamwhitmania sp.]|nr:C1 family peptidase [Williamwhitmania sp.]
MIRTRLFLLILFLGLFTQINAQDTISAGGYHFTTIKKLPITSVKDQYRSGTCWSFATVSYVESELLRMGKPDLNLSEMFFVREAYLRKAVSYVRRQGTSNFSEGGQAHDVLNIIKDKGMVPDSVYPGLNYGEPKPVHAELYAVLDAYVGAVVKNPDKKLSTAWKSGFVGILDAYLGAPVTSFTYDSKKTTPTEFTKKLGFNPDDYVELTSFPCYPFNKKVLLEIPDNWSNGLYYNVPLDDLVGVVENAINKGYTVCWDGDVGNPGFEYSKGIAVYPDDSTKEVAGLEMAKWTAMTSAEKRKVLYGGEGPVPEKIATEAERQADFDNYTLTDDHLMHLVGTVVDQDGKRFYIIKNSWNKDSNKYGGLLYMSQPYLRRFTIAVMVHKDAIPSALRKRLGI